MVSQCKARRALVLAAAAVTCGASLARGQAVFSDSYGTDSSANYTATDGDPNEKSVWTVNNGVLNYSRTGTASWSSGVFLTNPSVASTAGIPIANVSGDFIGATNYTTGNYYQPGLVISGDPTKGGFTVQEYENGAFQYHMVLLRQTGAQLIGDEGGTGNPPVLADLGSIAGHLTDNYHVSAIIDRTGAHPSFIVSIDDLTTGLPVITGKAVTDSADPASFGGTQVGWRARFDNNQAAFGVDNLSITNAPEPASMGLLMSGAVAMMFRRRRAR
jgi:hypothetical protein